MGRRRLQHLVWRSALPVLLPTLRFPRSIDRARAHLHRVGFCTVCHASAVRGFFDDAHDQRASPARRTHHRVLGAMGLPCECDQCPTPMEVGCDTDHHSALRAIVAVQQHDHIAAGGKQSAGATDTRAALLLRERGRGSVDRHSCLFAGERLHVRRDWLQTVPSRAPESRGRHRRRRRDAGHDRHRALSAQSRLRRRGRPRGSHAKGRWLPHVRGA